MKKLIYKLGFTNGVYVDANGSARGPALAWTEEVSLECVFKKDRVISCNIKREDSKVNWTVFACHGTLYNTEKSSFWSQFECNVTNGRHL